MPPIASSTWYKSIRYVLKRQWSAVTDLLPIIVVIVFFQAAVIRQPLPNLGEILFGTLLVVIGLSMFIEGLETTLFPLGEAMAHSLTRKGSLFWLLLFSFTLGFATTVAEPALIAISSEAAAIAASGGLIDDNSSRRDSYALGLRLVVAFSVGFSILIGVLRILRNWPLHYLIIGGYIAVMVLTIFAPQEIIGIAYDAGGVTTSTITVPLVTALGVGLATIIRGRNLPMVFVMGYGLFVF
jgi:Protein of unknown function (DUF1538)